MINPINKYGVGFMDNVCYFIDVKDFRQVRRKLEISLDTVARATGINIGYVNRFERGLVDINNVKIRRKLYNYYKSMKRKEIIAEAE